MHTPGPWRVQAVFPDAAQGHTFTPAVSILANCAEFLNQTIRLADIPDVRSPDSEEMANARLMAAAPELLAAVSRLIWEDTSRGTFDRESHGYNMTLARAAVAKATQP